MIKIKEFFTKIFKLIITYSRYVYPGIALVLGLVVTLVSLNLNKKETERRQQEAESVKQEEVIVTADLAVPLEVSASDELFDFFSKYYEYLSNGDSSGLLSICDTIDESNLIKYEEQAKYLNYTLNEIYTQQGPTEDTYIVYAYCYVVFNEYPELNFPAYRGFYIRTNDYNEFYIVNGVISDDENEYIEVVKEQDDVVELINKVNVEYNDIVLENPYILNYLVELDTVISETLGERLAEINASEEQNEDDADTELENQFEDIPLENETIYATTTTSVNVRASDSTNSDRLGEASKGTMLEVVEQQVNGWTKVIYEGQVAYISSEFISLVQSASSVDTIGIMTAKDNVNIRSNPDTESAIVGAVVTGDSYEMAAIEDGWVTIKFEGILAYVNAQYCDYTIFE